MSQLTIGIDMRGTQTYSFHRGIGLLWRELMAKLSKIDGQNKYILIYAKNFPAPDDQIAYPPNFVKIQIRTPYFRKKLSIPYLWLIDKKIIKRILLKFGAEIIVSTSFPEVWFPDKPYSKLKNIIWIYDVIPFIFPNEYFKKVKYGFFKKYLMSKKLKNCQKIDKIITISDATKKDILRLINYQEDKINVIPLGVNEIFFNYGKKSNDELMNKIGYKQSYILYIGGIDYRKNLFRTLEGYVLASKKVELPILIIAGQLNKQHRDYKTLIKRIKELRISNKIKFLGFVPSEILPALYANAQFLLFPSLYEGFGLPVLEAMAAGCPVLTSNTSAIPEVAGDCALMVNPYDVYEIAEAIVRLSTDENLRQKLIECGLKRARQFSWEKTAEKFLQTLEEVAKNE